MVSHRVEGSTECAQEQPRGQPERGSLAVEVVTRIETGGTGNTGWTGEQVQTLLL